jgi:hypothetical protein
MVLNCIQLHHWPAFLIPLLLFPLFSQVEIGITSELLTRPDENLSAFHEFPGCSVENRIVSVVPGN